MKKVLIIAYYFPPMGMGGVQRIAKFVKYLPDFGWDPVVFTVKDVLYNAWDDSLLEEIREREIIRTESLDPQRLYWKVLGSRKKCESHLVGKRGSLFMERVNRFLLPWALIPDPKVLWLPCVLREAESWINSNAIDLLFTTSPPQSVHLAGLRLRKNTGLPWIADFRDNWLTKRYENVPTPIHRRLNDRMVRRVVRGADRIITVSEPITDNLIQRSGKQARNFLTLPNGYDVTDFSGIRPRPHEQFTITYCGALDPVRNPEIFFRGVARAVRGYPEIRKKMRIQLVGSIHGIDCRRMIHRNGLDDMVEIVGYVPHRESIEYMMASDLLLLLISDESGSDLVTGKIYEYLASAKPILAIVPKGEASKLVLEYARGVVVPPNNEDGITAFILRLYFLWERGDLRISVPRWGGMADYERRHQTGKLAELFDKLLSDK